MKYIVACNSDVGAVKESNQDALAVRQYSFATGEAVFAILCDGMGGLEQGEVASSSLVKAYVDWFEALFLSGETVPESRELCQIWDNILSEMNQRIYQYGEQNGIKIGTTLTMLLLWNNRYYAYNVGDCRVYEFDTAPVQVTQDHSVVAEEIVAGRLTKDEARIDSRRNQLTKCVGVSPKTMADFYTGIVKEQSVFMLCCDGVRTKLNDEELFYYFHPTCMKERRVMENNIQYVFTLNKERGEADNMSVILIKENAVTERMGWTGEKSLLYQKDIIPSEKTVQE